MALRIGLLGATGRTGSEVRRRIEERDDLLLIQAFSRRSLPFHREQFTQLDVLIDFSLPEALAEALPLMGTTPLVTGTTGLSEQTQRALHQRSRHAPVLTAANFSTGVNVLASLVAIAAKALPRYDIEIIEAHHRGKRDAPSGTALFLANQAALARGQTLRDVVQHGRSGSDTHRPAGQIGVHALRCGGVVGEHSVWLAGPDERLTLGHCASSRATFANGALRAARWIANQPPGFYGMSDALGLRQSPS